MMNEEDFHWTDVVALDDGRFMISHRNYDAILPPVAMVDGTAVTLMDSFPSVTAHINAMDVGSDGSVWTVGGRDAYRDDGTEYTEALVLNWDGSNWNDHSPPGVEENVYSVSEAEGEVFVTLNAGLLRYREGEWQEIPVPTMENLWSVGAVSPQEVYLGRSPVSLFDGDTVTVAEALRGVWAYNFAVGDAGTLFVGGHDEEALNAGEQISVLAARFDGEWKTLVRHPDAMSFGSVATNGTDLFALDSRFIWRGACGRAL